ncbi:adenylyl-sulfate kinase [Butyrivibrio fibrisolvens]|uniref:adenylyl-sulfate kinase n=1 Tax=Pseudobutyrivibrio ruminis TaxID=46206 RepID=UPI0004883A35|nr:adenylyl-sulfate kinase [Pseudobutyrivibrio ruminis]MDC7279120.1 adenylyl-sulfate kinase [Butyrivibrio fibrisolvens]
MIIWLIGISGAGKTTLGKLLEQHLKECNKKCYLVDGDEVRSLFNNDLGYTDKDRRENIKRIILGAYLLDKNDIIGIICNISPFQELRDLARDKIKDYNEIFLDKDLNISVRNDVKGMYKNNIGKTDIVGIGQRFDDPITCDLRIKVDDMTEDESFKIIKDYLVRKYGEEYE